MRYARTNITLASYVLSAKYGAFLRDIRIRLAMKKKININPFWVFWHPYYAGKKVNG